jgi:hypothetical protein
MKTVGLVVLLMSSCALELGAQTVVQQFSAVSSGAGQVSDMDLPEPTAPGSVLIAMPELLTPDIDVVSITDNAPDGGNTYKQVKGANASCAKKTLQIWYCENCKAGVTELKFHLSGHVRSSINGFLEVSNLALSSVLDASASLSDGKGTAQGLQAGPSVQTMATDFVIARYSFMSNARGVMPESWTFKPAYVYGLNLPAGTYRPTLTGAAASGDYCMSVAAFKVAVSVPAPMPSH